MLVMEHFTITSKEGGTLPTKLKNNVISVCDTINPISLFHQAPSPPIPDYNFKNILLINC